MAGEPVQRGGGMLNWVSTVIQHPAVLVGLGGAVGANARYWLGSFLRSLAWMPAGPWTTFAINVTGSLLLGAVAALCRDRAGPWFLLLGTGVCGGYTTFSTFSLELAEAIDRSQWGLAGLYAGGSVLASLTAFIVAYACLKT